MRGRRARAAAAGALALAAVLAGCGIRPTEVPVDAGPAPSRVACAVPGGDEAAAGVQASVVRVYLVCGSRLVSLERAVRLPTTRVATARTLLEELREKPDTEERAAGFVTDVPDGLTVGAGALGDPAGTLRLSTAPDRLPRAALAQLVCTWAASPRVGEGRAVVLAGPPGEEGPPLRFACDDATRERPSDAAVTGLPV